MKKVILMFMLLAIAPAFAANESEISNETMKDSTKQYDSGDILMSIGGTFIGSGIITTFSSRILGFSMMGTGGIISGIGIGIKTHKAIKKRGNRGG